MKKTLAFLFLFTAALFSCDGGEKDDVVTISTPYGDMVVILYDETPQHKQNFLKLAREKYYDSTLFHRVISGFMIQGGDPESKTAEPYAPLGNGGPGYTVPAELRPNLFHEKGSLAAARLGDNQNPERASSGSQFYIVQGTVIPEGQQRLDYDVIPQAFNICGTMPEFKAGMDSLAIFYRAGDRAGYEAALVKMVPRMEKVTSLKLLKDVQPEKLKAYSTVGGVPFLDGSYTVFGKVVQGLDVIDKIAALQKDPNDRPLKDCAMSMSVKSMSKKKIEKEYGYKYPETKKG